jgi:hypothetical protein
LGNASTPYLIRLDVPIINQTDYPCESSFELREVKIKCSSFESVGTRRKAFIRWKVLAAITVLPAHSITEVNNA